MNRELKLKADVIRDLLARGAEEVSITGTNIKVKKPKKQPRTSGGPTQIVNVQTQANVQTNLSLPLRLNFAHSELKNQYKRNKKKISEINSKVKSLEKELSKGKYSKGTLKKTLNWALNFGWDAFVKIAPIIIDKVSGK